MVKSGDIAREVAAAVAQALAETSSGDVLVFLAGAHEIRACQRELTQRLPKAVKVLPLYGALPLVQQDAAVRLDPDGVSPTPSKFSNAFSLGQNSRTLHGIGLVFCSTTVASSQCHQSCEAAGGKKRSSSQRVCALASRTAVLRDGGRDGQAAFTACSAAFTA